MTSDSTLPVPAADPPTSLATANLYSQVRLKSEAGKLWLILPTAAHKDLKTHWAEVCQELKYSLKNSDGTYQPETSVNLLAHEQLLDSRQLQAIAEALQAAQLQLKWIYTSRRQTAVAAATAGYSVEQASLMPLLSAKVEPQSPLAEPLYLKTTVRSGIEIRHPGKVIVDGDINPGGAVIADGDILVWGCLRGLAHAGAKGNQTCRIMALRLEPTQLRIADRVARAPATSPTEFEPEVAYLASEGIRITGALNFSKTHTFAQTLGVWLDKKDELGKPKDEQGTDSKSQR